MDVAGSSATKRGIDLAQGQGFNIKVITMPSDSDPADIISQNPKNWEKLVKETKSILDFYFETTFSRFERKTPEGKKEISKILLPVIKRIPNQIEKSFWIQKLSKELEVREEDIREELKKVKLEEEVYGLESEEIINLPQKSRKELLEERLIITVLKFPQNLSLIEKAQTSYFSPKIQTIFANLKEGFPSLKKMPPELKNYFNYLSLKSEIEEIEEKDILSEIQYCLKEIQSLEVKNKLELISKEIKIAEEERDLKKIEELTKKFNIYSKSLCDLEK
jgi:DNA primase